MRASTITRGLRARLIKVAVIQLASTPNASTISVSRDAGPVDSTIQSGKSPSRESEGPLGTSTRNERKERRSGSTLHVLIMPEELTRGTQSLVRRLATNTELSPACAMSCSATTPTKGCLARAVSLQAVYPCSLGVQCPRVSPGKEARRTRRRDSPGDMRRFA